jgi:hypothetical protein
MARCRQMPSRPNGDVGRRLAEREVQRLTAVARKALYALPMPVLVLRKSVDDERVGGPFSCADPQEIARVIGRLTLEERVAHLLAADEAVRVSEDGHVKIYSGDQLVGYIVILSAD